MTKVLVVEPEPPLRAELCRALEGRYETRALANGAEAFDALAHGAPDVLVLDLELPDVTTLELLTAVRHRTHRDTPVVFVSRVPRRALRMGSWGPIVVPPLTRGRVLVCIEEALLESELRRARRLPQAPLAKATGLPSGSVT